MTEQRKPEGTEKKGQFQEEQRITLENLWTMITLRQGETIYTVKNLPFTYEIRGGELFTERKRKSITRATFERAYTKIQEDREHRITGPKALNCFGGPYVWAIFRAMGIVGLEPEAKQQLCLEDIMTDSSPG
ncbi:hypothetical protein AALB16_05080 [Lachnospiraceae bacterium 62-35]